MIKVEHLYKEYSKGKLVLNDINCTISKGETIAVIGPSGSGKSTFINCLNLLESPTSGKIFIGGEDITAQGYKPDMLRKKVGMVFQDFRLFDHLNVLDNIKLAPMTVLGLSKEEAEAKAYELLKMVGLLKKADTMPRELSGGQKQRVAIARTLAMSPEVILFDEPTSALDPSMVSEVIAVIAELAKKGYTIIIVTHRFSLAEKLANRVFFMHKGTIWEDGPAKQLFNTQKTEEARHYIRRIKNFHYEIDSNGYDLYHLNSSIYEFSCRHFFSKKRLISLYHIVEEMLMILDKEKGVDISIEFREDDNSAVLTMLQKGAKINFEAKSDIYPISLSIVKGFCQNFEYEWCEEGTKITMSIPE